MADVLSRRVKDENQDEQAIVAEEEEVDKIIDANLNAIRIEGEVKEFQGAEYSGIYKTIGEYLVTLQRNEDMSIEDFGVIKRKAEKFMVFQGHLFKKGKRNAVPRRVVCDVDK